MSSGYLLNRDSSESERLEQQHRFWVETFDYIIHPAIQLPTTAQVADIGTGTAIWAADFGYHNPSAKITAFDISDAQFPAKSSLPSNVILKVHSVLDPFPEHMHETFDLIHLRLLLLGMPGQDDYVKAVKNCVALLKPGGFIQWEEGDFSPSIRPCRWGGAGTHSLSAMKRGMSVITTIAAGRHLNVLENLITALEDNGLKNVAFDIVASDKSGERGRELATALQYRVVEGMMKQWRADRGQVPPLGTSAEEDEKTLNDMRREMEQGAYVVYFMQCVYGRKEA